MFSFVFCARSRPLNTDGRKYTNQLNYTSSLATLISKLKLGLQILIDEDSRKLSLLKSCSLRTNRVLLELTQS